MVHFVLGARLEGTVLAPPAIRLRPDALMDNTEFRALVARLERRAAERPGAYRAEVAGLAFLGYAYVFAVLAVLVALLVGLIALAAQIRGGGGLAGKLALPIAFVMYAIIRALWVRMPPPEGIVLTRGETRKLYDVLDAISDARAA